MHPIWLFLYCWIFKASAFWANALYKSICPCVCLSVCSLLKYHLIVFLPPLPKVECPTCLEIRNPWGKVIKRSGLRLNKTNNKEWKIAAQKKIVFWQILPYLGGFFWYWCFLLRLMVFLPPTSRSPISKPFIFSKSFGKSNGKKCSQILKMLLIKGVKSPRKKS